MVEELLELVRFQTRLDLTGRQSNATNAMMVDQLVHRYPELAQKTDSNPENTARELCRIVTSDENTAGDIVSFSARTAGMIGVNCADEVVRRDKLPPAVRELEVRIASSPNDPEALFAMGRWFQSQSEYEMAMDMYAKAICLNPNTARFHAARGCLLATSVNADYRDGEAAVEAASKAVSLAETDDEPDGCYQRVQYLQILAAAYAEAGNFEQAIKCQSQVVMHKATADIAAAEWDLRIAQQKGELNSGHRHKLRDLALAYAEAGDFEEAIKWQEEAVRVSVNSKSAFQIILDTYRSGRLPQIVSPERARLGLYLSGKPIRGENLLQL